MQLARSCTTTQITDAKDSVDFTFYKGTTFRVVFTFKDANDAPLDLTYTDILFNFVKKDGSPFLVIDSTTATQYGSIISIPSPPQSGVAQLLITDEETSLIPFDQGYWWITLLVGGDKLLRARGKIFIKEPYE